MTTTTSINRDAQLSTIANAAYLDTPPLKITIGGVTWEYIDKSASTSGFFGVAYRNPQTNEIAIAYRGSDGRGDLSADFTFGFGGWSQQFTDAAKFTKDVKDLTSGDRAKFPGAKLITTGHSLGDGIAQIMGKMFSLDGAGFDGPGASRVVDTAQFAIVKEQYAKDTTGQIGSYTSYRVSGSGISFAGTHLGEVDDKLLNLSKGSLAGLASFVAGAVGIATGGLFTALLGVAGINITSNHPIDGLERAMHIRAGLENALGLGQLSMAEVGLSLATGQPWTGDGLEPRVVVFKNASGQRLAYVQSIGNSWKLSTPDGQTSITLTPPQTEGQPPLCVVNQVGKEPYSCVIEEAGGVLTRKIDTGLNGTIDQTTTQQWLSDTVFGTKTYESDRTNPISQRLDIGPVNYNLFDLNQRSDAEYRLNALRSGAGQGLNLSAWNDFTSDSTRQLLGGGSGLTPGGGGYGLQPPAGWLDPIGAFYDSQSAAFDNAASIAHKTTRATHLSGYALSTNQLAALDTNADGQISTAEAARVRLWADLNENGTVDYGELQRVGSAIKADDYGFYTRGNSTPAGAKLIPPTVVTVGGAGSRPQAPSASAPSYSATSVASAPATPTAASLPSAPAYGGVPDSNYRTLRDTDNRYWIDGANWIDFAASQVKINNSNRSYLIGTDGNDNFDSNYYAAYAQYFNSGLLTNFLAGGGNDEMGGSTRNDNLWGGTGNDTLDRKMIHRKCHAKQRRLHRAQKTYLFFE